ncbi:unnamed protein product [Nyctereutes procyonoides]|uniref:(raccoon dog) hypothetical protein n=1 Tax=Nyctereutes procyonoides TaxID=34880 RepID=A0A811Z4B0_NYCPR|nr:unnamed protein product [Nyctereutes procyonoides]
MFYYELPNNYLSEVYVEKGNGSWVSGSWSTRSVLAQLGWSMTSGLHALTHFIILPGVGVCMLKFFLKSHQGEFKPFTWGHGNCTLFYNSHVNPLPTGYQDE